MGKVFIPGGLDPMGHRVRRFHVGDEHTVFDWCMIYTDRHPGWFLPNLYDATAKDREDRLTLLGANWSNVPRWRPHPTKTDAGLWDDQAVFRTSNAVYQELVDDIMSRRVDAKRAYLDDRPRELDPTLCVIGKDPVLAVARRRRDHGRIITRLLAIEDEAIAPSSSEPEETVETTAADTASIERLAEWIFAQHGTGTTFKTLYDRARRAPEIGGFKKADFQIAYRLVYDTKSHRPPVTGWPLKSPYRERWKETTAED